MIRDFIYGDLIVYAGVKRGKPEFTFIPVLKAVLYENKINPEIFIWIEDAQQQFAKHLDRGAEIIETISDRPRGTRQYVFKDQNGYHLKFVLPL